MSLDLATVRSILDEVTEVIDRLDGRSHHDTGARSDGRADVSRDLNFAADRLQLAAGLVRHEYWAARGRSDHFHDRSN